MSDLRKKLIHEVMVMAYEEGVEEGKKQAKRPTGEWIFGIDEETGEQDCYAWTCSECGEKYPWQPNFCPNCGAKMRGGDSE